MSDIELLRKKVKVAFTDLVYENENVKNMDPLNEIFEFLNEGYINMGKPEYVKEIRKDFVLKEEDILKNDLLDDDLSEEEDDEYNENSGDSIFTLPFTKLIRDETLDISLPEIQKNNNHNSIFSFLPKQSNNNESLFKLPSIPNPLSFQNGGLFKKSDIEKK